MMMLGNIAKGVFTIGQGIAAQRQAELDAFNVGTERVLAKASALMDTRVRDEALREALSANMNFFGGVLNREITADLEASMQKDKDISGEDLDNITFMNRMNDLKLGQEAAAIRQKGKNTLLASVFDAAYTVGMGYADYKDVMSSKPITPQSQWRRTTMTSPRPRLR